MRSPRHLTAYEFAYLGARAVLGLNFGLVYASGEFHYMTPSMQPLFIAAGVLSSVTSAAVVVALLFARLDSRKILLAALVPDLLGIVMAVAASHRLGDPAFVWVLGFAVVYALLVPFHESILATIGVAVVYFAAAAVSFSIEATDPLWTTQVTKMAGVIVLGYFTASAVQRHARRQSELLQRGEDIEALNSTLQDRIVGLSMVAEVAEIVHSSLDFDTITPAIEARLRVLLSTTDAELRVIDKTTGDIVFKAGEPRLTAVSGSTPRHAPVPPLPAALRDTHTLFEGQQMRVELDVAEEHFSALGDEGQLVLQAIASELAVAAEKIRLFKLTRQLAITDELTGLFNRRHLQDRLAEEFERARRYNRPVSLLMIDIDHFKQLNDREGHVTGDVTLSDVARLLVEQTRDADIVARYGGEEFAIVLPENGPGQALVVAEKVRAAAAERAFRDAHGRLSQKLTVSVGVASFPRHANDEIELVTFADQALYDAKRLGRDRVCIASHIAAFGKKRE